MSAHARHGGKLATPKSACPSSAIYTTMLTPTASGLHTRRRIVVISGVRRNVLSKLLTVQKSTTPGNANFSTLYIQHSNLQKSTHTHFLFCKFCFCQMKRLLYGGPYRPAASCRIPEKELETDYCAELAAMDERTPITVTRTKGKNYFINHQLHFCLQQLSNWFLFQNFRSLITG